MSLKENKGSAPAASVKPTKRTVFAVRDFPNNCGPAKTWCFQVPENSKDCEVKPETKADLFSQDSITSDEFQQMESKVLAPPCRRVSATRTFPPGCGTKALQKKGKLQKKDKTGASGKSSKHESKNPSEGMMAVSTHREIVQALKATGKCALMTAEKREIK